MDELETLSERIAAAELEPAKAPCPKGQSCKCARWRDWAITLWEHKGHFENLEKALSRYNYVGQFEIAPTTGKVHAHFFVQTPARNNIARHIFDEAFPGGHFEKVRSPADYERYCQKDDTVMFDDNQQPRRFRQGDLQIVGSGAAPRETILDQLWQTMMSGTTLDELLRTDARALRYIEKLEKLERRLFPENCDGQYGSSHASRLLKQMART